MPLPTMCSPVANSQQVAKINTNCITKIALWEYKGIQEDIHSFCEKNYLTTPMIYNESN